MKNTYSIALSQVARAIHALDVNIADLLKEDHRLLDGNIAKIAEGVLRENNDRSRRVIKSFLKRYHKQLSSSVTNLDKVKEEQFPNHILKTATNLLKLSEDKEEINKSSWRTVNSIFGQLCELEQISKRNASNRRKMFNAWNAKDGLMIACYDSLLLKKQVQDDDRDYPMDSCSSESNASDSEEEAVGRKTHPIGFTGCVIRVGIMRVEQPLLALMDESRESLNLCIKELIEALCKGCVVNINRVNFNQGVSPRMTGYAYCSHSNCRLYKFTISVSSSKSKPAKFQLYADKVSCHHKGKMTRALKGLERNLEKENLEKVHPYTHRLNALNDCDVDVALRGNLQGVRNPHVFRKARSEVLAKNDLHKDDIVDIMKMMELPDYSDYVQSVGKPFHAYLWSTKMHKVAQKVCKKGAPHNYLYFDATGSVVKSQNKKQVYLYGGGFQYGKEIYPAFDFLLSAHKTDDIALPLISYRRSVLDVTNTWPLFPLVVMDDSMAMRSALSIAWNLMPLNKYIENAYQWMKDGFAPKDMVVMQGCNSHFAKRVCQGATKFAEKGSTLRKFMAESVIAMCQMKDFDSLMQLYRQLVIIFNSEFKSALLRTSLQALQATLKDNQVKEEEFQPTDEEMEENEGLWEGSPLSIHLKEIETQELQHLRAHKDPSVDSNPFYSPLWYKYMVKTFAPKLVFNSAIFLQGNKVSISNQLQENSHRILKVVLLKNERKKKPGRFIRIQKKRISALIKLHDLRLGKKPAMKSKSLISYEEKFKKHLRNKTAHTSLKAVKKIDLALVSSKAVKKKAGRKSTMTTRKRPSPSWKFELSDEEPDIKVQKLALTSNLSPKKPSVIKVTKPVMTKKKAVTTPQQTPGVKQIKSKSATTVKDLLLQFGSDDFPPLWQKTSRFFQNSEINEATLKKIVKNQWLDDETINGFLHTRLGLSPDHSKKFLLFNTLHTGYAESGLGISTKRFIKMVKPLEYDVWLVPVNVSAIHWALFIVLPRQQILLYVDSLNMSATEEFTSVASIIQFTLQLQGEEASLEDWVGVKCTDAIQQNNASDCGVFLCLYAQVVTSGKALQLHPDDGRIGRIWLVWELCHADEPKVPVKRAPWIRIGELASDLLPELKMKVKCWDKKADSMSVLAKILTRATDVNFRNEIV
jgi:Ulp1 protease family, C-terminal catalytic domain